MTDVAQSYDGYILRREMARRSHCCAILGKESIW